MQEVRLDGMILSDILSLEMAKLQNKFPYQAFWLWRVPFADVMEFKEYLCLQKSVCRSAEDASDIKSVCQKSCQTACKDSLEEYRVSTGLESGLPPSKQSLERPQKLCTRSCSYECQKEGSGYRFTVNSNRWNMQSLYFDSSELKILLQTLKGTKLASSSLGGTVLSVILLPEADQFRNVSARKISSNTNHEKSERLACIMW